MPSNQEIAGWLRELLAEYNEVSINPVKGKLLGAKKARIWLDRADLIESMRCETCRHYNEHYEQVTNYNRRVSMCLKGYTRDQNPQFSCCHWEGKK